MWNTDVDGYKTYVMADSKMPEYWAEDLTNNCIPDNVAADLWIQDDNGG